MARRGKYNNRRTVVDGIVFHSKREADYYCKLKALENAGRISSLLIQVPYKLVVNGVLICSYIADFVFTMEDKQHIVDVKGFRTREYLIKKKLMKAILDLNIEEW